MPPPSSPPAPTSGRLGRLGRAGMRGRTSTSCDLARVGACTSSHDDLPSDSEPCSDPIRACGVSVTLCAKDVRPQGVHFPSQCRCRCPARLPADRAARHRVSWHRWGPAPAHTMTCVPTPSLAASRSGPCSVPIWACSASDPGLRRLRHALYEGCPTSGGSFPFTMPFTMPAPTPMPFTMPALGRHTRRGRRPVARLDG